MLTDYDLALLKFQVSRTQKAAYAPGTNQAHIVQWGAYLKFCLYYGLQYVPVTSEILCLYAQFLSRSFKTTAAICNYISGVKTMHTLLDKSTEAFSGVRYKLTIKGLARNLHHAAQQAAPITPDILLSFLKFLDLKEQEDATFWSLFLTAFFTMARKSNLVPDSVGKYDPEKQLSRGKVLVGKHSILVTWSWAKNIQFGQRLHKVPLLEIKGSPLCPVKAYVNMCNLVRADSHHAAFSVVKDQKVVPITYNQYQKKLKQLITRGGRNPDKYSTHSFRRGGATCAFQAQVPTELIQIQGDWASEAYKQYVKLGMEEKMLVASKMAGFISGAANNSL